MGIVKVAGILFFPRILQPANIASSLDSANVSGFGKLLLDYANVSGFQLFLLFRLTFSGFRLQLTDSAYRCGFRDSVILLYTNYQLCVYSTNRFRFLKLFRILQFFCGLCKFAYFGAILSFALIQIFVSGIQKKQRKSKNTSNGAGSATNFFSVCC